MFNGATVTLAGYVATEPNYKTINETTPKVSMRVAWNSRYLDRVTGEWRDGRTSYANVNCWRKLANNVAPSLRKGEAVVVTGRLQVREYDDKEGRRRISVDIEADAIGHDLSRGVTHFMRTLRSAGDEAAPGQSDGLAMGETIRAGLADEDGTGGHLHDPSPAGEFPIDGAGMPDDVFDQDAVEALGRAIDEPAAAVAPF
jgi:single-strand DNA-binding protein